MQLRHWSHNSLQMLSKPINWSGDLQAQIIKVQGENQNQQSSGTLSSKFAG